MKHEAATGTATREDDAESRTEQSWQDLKYPRPVHYDAATIFQKLLATWASPFLERGNTVSACSCLRAPQTPQLSVHIMGTRVIHQQIQHMFGAGGVQARGCRAAAVLQ